MQYYFSICYDMKPVLKTTYVHDLCITFTPKIQRNLLQAFLFQ